MIDKWAVAEFFVVNQWPAGNFFAGLEIPDEFIAVDAECPALSGALRS
ncbi:MAG: hypothetical protein ONB46_20005 [candidate division KSB1 bacterium]|nr:hypothetical protein [candidate division KSB1 bacterium]MDZ7369256.1 hypothetical protein [candidate division KSB1 bacterium]